MAQSAGAPYIGDQPGLSVDTATGTQIERYHVVQVSTSTNHMQVGLCETADANRDLACGIAFTAWPHVPQAYEDSRKPITDISGDTDRPLAVRQSGFSWMKVEIPSGGSNVSIAPGDWLVPSTQSPGSVEPKPASSLTASYASADILADILEERVSFARAYSVIRIPDSGPSWGGMPSLQSGTPVAQLTALTNAITYGYVFGRINKG